METAWACGKQIGRPEPPPDVVARIEELAKQKNLSILQITAALDGEA